MAAFEAAATTAIERLLKDVENSAPNGLKDRVKLQGEVCREEAHVAVQKTVGVVRDTLQVQQKEVSRSLVPHVQQSLVDGYNRAMEERGKGSVARQKVQSMLSMPDLTLMDVRCDRISFGATFKPIRMPSSLAARMLSWAALIRLQKLSAPGWTMRSRRLPRRFATRLEWSGEFLLTWRWS